MSGAKQRQARTGQQHDGRGKQRAGRLVHGIQQVQHAGMDGELTKRLAKYLYLITTL